MGGESGRGGIDIGHPGGAADRLRFNRAIGVQLELNDRILANAGGLAPIESINFPRAFVEGVEPCVLFPNGTVGVFPPLIAVAVVFPKDGVFGDGAKVEVSAKGSGGGMGSGIVLQKQFPGGEEMRQRKQGGEERPHRWVILRGVGWEAIGKLEGRRGVRRMKNGRVAERFNVPDSKSGVGVTLPWVQIPPRPSLRGRGESLPAGGEM